MKCLLFGHAWWPRATVRGFLHQCGRCGAVRWPREQQPERTASGVVR